MPPEPTRALAAALHFTPAHGAVTENRERLLELVEQAARQAAVVVCPELATTGFALTPEQAGEWAESSEGDTAVALGELAAKLGAVVVCGLALRERQGALCNAQLVWDSDGSLAGVYRKHHLYGTDLDWATRGEEPGSVVATRAYRIGLLICHDIVYPHTVRRVTSARPDLLAFSTAWLGTGEPVPASWLSTAIALGGAPLVAANRGGREGELEFGDPSAVVAYDSDQSKFVGVQGEPGLTPQLLLFPSPR